MLRELSDMQSSDEEIRSIELSFETVHIEEDGTEILEVYTFGYAKEWDKWMFVEYEKYRDNYRTERVMWSDTEVPDIDVPQSVANALSEATGATEVVLQKP